MEVQSGAQEPPLKRLKTRNACEPCKVRKKKCDGQEPCLQCVRYEYKCHYNIRPSKVDQHRALESETSPKQTSTAKRTPSESNKSSIPATPGKHDDQDVTTMTPTEVASGVLWSKKMGIRFDPDGTQQKPSKPTWNIGFRNVQFLGGHPTPIFQFITPEQLVVLADRYHEAMLNCYDILTKTELMNWCAARLHRPDSELLHPVHDAVLSCVAALGMLFSLDGDSQLEINLINNAKHCIDAAEYDRPPAALVLAHTLRVIYMRISCTPCVTWLASCTAVHAGEAAGLYQTQARDNPPNWTMEELTPKNRVRLAGLTKMVNGWVSFECGHPRIDLSSFVDPRPFSEIPALEQLGTFAWVVDPKQSPEISDVERAFEEMETVESENDCVEISKAFLGVSMYRRRFVIHPNMTHDFKQRLLKLGKSGLQAVERLLLQHAPWWHLPHLPLQFLCVLLVMETSEALSEVANTLRVLQAVARKYDTELMRETVKYAFSIVQGAMRRKERDQNILSTALRLDEEAEGHAINPTASNGAVHDQLAGMSGTDHLPRNSWDDFDWNHFTFSGTAAFDLPEFSSFTPAINQG